MKLVLLPEDFTLCRLAPDQEVPAWAWSDKSFLAITYTADELSIVCPSAVVPGMVICDRGWRAIKVEGPLDFSLTGVLATLASPLAAGEISIFALSTFDTDYVLVHDKDVTRARMLLEQLGHTFA